MVFFFLLGVTHQFPGFVQRLFLNNVSSMFIGLVLYCVILTLVLFI